MKDFQYEIVTIPEYRAIGLKWNGSYSEVEQLKEIIKEMSKRVHELDDAISPEYQLGLSYHLRPDGFTHYSVYEVSDKQVIPNGMIEIFVPELTYLKTQHKKGENIGETYMKILQWMKESEYDIYKEKDIDYFDELPIKHETYTSDRDLMDPHFVIHIPILKMS
ncbi:GyrI-like domain-containing protein [Cytobacillus sp.]|uniref:GyrI-like domain-containing protein n=1 Tax=Cytobacillus sp. TaxID=2675269 RepID=UPI0028BEFDD8|nr:GyrI-like domain-containing protein [Cytobacillus sp.]